MRSKRMSLSHAKLYLILDRQVNTYDELFEIARQAILEGVDIIQLRDKNGAAKDILHFANRIKKLTGNKVPFIINDRIDLAMLCGAAGVHLGQDDIPLKMARQMMGSRAIIGVSCQTSAHVQKAVESGADYIGFGSVFKTLTKPQRGEMNLSLLSRVFNGNSVPIFAIGGINIENVGQISKMGVNRIAVCRSICESSNIKQAVRSFKIKLDETFT